MACSVVGGTAGVLGGGKFENGAVTAAFGYLFNECVYPGGGCSLLELDPPIESVCPECGLTVGVLRRHQGRRQRDQGSVRGKGIGRGYTSYQEVVCAD